MLTAKKVCWYDIRNFLLSLKLCDKINDHTAGLCDVLISKIKKKKKYVRYLPIQMSKKT